MDGPALVSGRVTMGKWRLANWRIGGPRTMLSMGVDWVFWKGWLGW